MRILKRWWWLLPVVLILVLGGFVIWAGTAAAPMPEALASLQSDAQVEVETDPWLVFQPVAGEGYLVVIVPMPLNLAFFAPDRAAEVMAAFPEISRWAVGGHSLGGAMSARFAYENSEAVQGLALWAAYPASTDDLSNHSLTVASIYGTRDGLATEDKIEASRSLLPLDTGWVAIEGGNHAQFGWYGPQSGDNAATISRDEQQVQIVTATLALLSELADQDP